MTEHDVVRDAKYYRKQWQLSRVRALRAQSQRIMVDAIRSHKTLMKEASSPYTNPVQSELLMKKANKLIEESLLRVNSCDIISNQILAEAVLE